MQKVPAKHFGEARICQARDAEGVLKMGAADAAEVLTSFYEDLYRAEALGNHLGEETQISGRIPISRQEVHLALKQLKEQHAGEMVRAMEKDLMSKLGPGVRIGADSLAGKGS